MTYWPAEWEYQKGTLLGFPCNPQDWPAKFNAVEWAFVDFIKKISTYQNVYLIVADEKHLTKVKKKLDSSQVDGHKIHFIIKQTNRNWLRDSGPIFVKEENSMRGLHFKFNAWAKYKNYSLDQAIPSTVCTYLDVPIEKITYKKQAVVLEGGAIEGNGAGTLITTRECLLSSKIQVRNPGLSQEDYETIFQNSLGTQQTIWLNQGIAGDDTHGHVDDLCRFIAKEKIIIASEQNIRDENYKILKENKEILEDVRLLNKKKPEIIEIPMPSPIYFKNTRLPASYVNFLFINDALLVPTFNDPNDYIALGLLQELLPEKKVIGIHALDLVWGLGTLHCLSQQVPLS